MLSYDEHLKRIFTPPAVIPVNISLRPETPQQVPVYRQERQPQRKLINLEDRINFMEINGFSAGTAVVTAVAYPLQMVDASTGGTAQVTINYGTVNALTPTVSGTPIATPGPFVTFGSAGTWRVYLDDVPNSSCTVGSIIGAQPADTATHGFTTLGEVDVASGGGGLIVTAIRNAKISSLNHVVCGASLHNWTLT